MTINLDTIQLDTGAHDANSGRMCLLEAASYIAGEPFSDHPQCVDPIIGAYGRRLNDLLPTEMRQELKQFLPGMLKTADDGKSDARRYLLADWATRTSLPRWLDLAGRTTDAAALRELPEIVDADSLVEGK